MSSSLHSKMAIWYTQKTTRPYAFRKFYVYWPFLRIILKVILGYILKMKTLQTLKCGALNDFVPFVQFKKREKHPGKSFNFSKVAYWGLQYSYKTEALFRTWSNIYVFYKNVPSQMFYQALNTFLKQITF